MIFGQIRESLLPRKFPAIRYSETKTTAHAEAAFGHIPNSQLKEINEISCTETIMKVRDSCTSTKLVNN